MKINFPFNPLSIKTYQHPLPHLNSLYYVFFPLLHLYHSHSLHLHPLHCHHHLFPPKILLPQVQRMLSLHPLLLLLPPSHPSWVLCPKHLSNQSPIPQIEAPIPTPWKTCSNSRTFKPKIISSFHTYIEPNSIQETLNQPHWRDAMKD